ncbi:MAG: NUDIX hydrolase [Actinomycetota bacterium]
MAQEQRQQKPASFRSLRMAETPEHPVEPRDSATVILARDGAEGPEIFMLERALRADFIGGAYVFPGGTVDAADRDAALAAVTDGPTPQEAAIPMQAPPDRALGFYLCAIRETFEEAGALLARRDGALCPVDDALDAERAQLNAGSLTLARFAQRYGLRFAADLLHPWARWVTPSASPKRYDARFFVASMPEGARDLLHDDVESASSLWIRPADALARHAGGEFPMIFPTRVTLTQIARIRGVDELIAAGARRDLSPVEPEIVQVGDAVKLLVPGDPDPYDP